MVGGIILAVVLGGGDSGSDSSPSSRSRSRSRSTVSDIMSEIESEIVDSEQDSRPPVPAGAVYISYDLFFAVMEEQGFTVTDGADSFEAFEGMLEGATAESRRAAYAYMRFDSKSTANLIYLSLCIGAETLMDEDGGAEESGEISGDGYEYSYYYAAGMYYVVIQTDDAVIFGTGMGTSASSANSVLEAFGLSAI